MQISRLFEIVYILLDRKAVTANELAEHFEVSVRTIYRDVDILSSAGIPVYASQGKGGGIALMEDYILNKSVLTEREQNEILFALQSLTVTQNPEAGKVLSRLSSLFNKSKINWIEVDFSPWGSNKNQICQFTVLKDAILNNHAIEFDYVNNSGEKIRRKVEPVRLVFKVNAWYLYGFCLYRNEYRTFKISRISQVQVTQVLFTQRPERFKEIQEQSSQKWINVKLKISSDGAHRVYDEFSEKDIVKNQDGSFNVDTYLPENMWMIRYLLSFGEDVEVLEPRQIRRSIREQAEKIFKKY
ncbi:MAG: transcriptional regulator, HTH-type [Eubacterium sp.]|jgi:predicted DNA-binding transcriptional regulator YafY|nr:transcriptional regulator, HTH-type [Eubacterium sp.]